jgi:hypothetical protein
MESIRKPRGLMGEKLVLSFNRAQPSSASVGFQVNGEFAVPPINTLKVNRGGGDLGSNGTEENVDLRAARYISYVQERFRLEKADAKVC